MTYTLLCSNIYIYVFCFIICILGVVISSILFIFHASATSRAQCGLLDSIQPKDTESWLLFSLSLSFFLVSDVTHRIYDFCNDHNADDFFFSFLPANNHAHSGRPAKAHGSGQGLGSNKANITTKHWPSHVKGTKLVTLWAAIHTHMQHLSAGYLSPPTHWLLGFVAP